ncbi:hypothetical protein FDZ61_04480 [Ehrlichia ruminantium]|uniref:Uncharacterized protein n=1 Tax=Ehrlichia ruminantium (strain Welgevonden) TaxID=254945 RepID=A0A0H3M0S2_EHRRW|nr:hypothetical protein [Ehrlichia ruminantium]QLK56399.1 hypothetical protein FDZ61_04480 [Ehrlichia ruminantium]CAH58530.1 hypothetical protein Erum7960 [Ehrlichia ruminantium str. Welgevonden]CAI27336.1 Hypothetical protein ERWE_CDS_08420 [Ehrlichia ruminantium str. Welgevonden]
MSKCVLLKVNQCLVILFLYVIFPCSSFSQCVDNGNVDNENSSNNVFHSIDEIDASVCDFCENIFRQFKLLNFRIFPFYMQSFFYPKASLMSAKGLIPVPKGDELLSADFKSMMAQYKNKQNILSSEYGVTYYGVHRHNMDSMCIYYEQMGNCVKQCLPIPPLKRPVLEEKDGKLITKFHVRKAIDSTMDSSTNAQYKYHDVVEEMNLEKLKSTVGKSVEIVKAEMGDHYDLKTEKIDDTKVSPNQNVNVKCISGLELPGKRYYIKKYDKTIGGHRYFWVRLNKKKLVRHIYDDQKNRYLPCDDSFSYDLENISMESFLKSVELHGDYYVIRNQQGNKYSGHVKQNSCRDSELYFYTSNYSKEIKDDKECIFGNIEYLSDNGKKVKHCLYKYTSDDFQTFGISRNVYELNKTDVFLTNKGELDGLIEENLYFQGMCVEKFPKYDYHIQRHADGEIEKQYMYEIGKYNQCNFLKIEAWGGGQAGDVEDGKAYNGTPGHYTLAVLDSTKVKDKKLMIHIGEGGKFPGQYGEDTVVAVCDNSNFDKCEVVLVARGCTTGECEEKHSLIKDDIVVHYRSATGMSFPKEMYNFRQYDKFIPWGSSYDFFNGTVGLSYQDCHGPVNSWEKNDNKYPGSGGCARVGKSIQQGADGMVKVTCEQWKTTDSSDSNKYAYYNGQLCRTQGGINQQECIKGICIYASDDNYTTIGYHEAITMFGDKAACKGFTVESGDIRKSTGLLSDLDSAKNDINIYYVGVQNITEQFCYTKFNKSETHYGSAYLIDSTGKAIGSQCRKKGEWPLLSCYMDRHNGGYKLYKCCYGTNSKGSTDNVCWKTSGSDVVKMFDYSSLPQDVRKAFDDGTNALLSRSSIASKRQYTYHDTNLLCRVNGGVNQRECIKGICLYVLHNNQYNQPIVMFGDQKQCNNVADYKSEYQQMLWSNNTASGRLHIFCKNEQCCYTNLNRLTRYNTLDEHRDYIFKERSGNEVYRVISKKCWKRVEKPLLSCYIDEQNKLHIRCCYGTNQSLEKTDDLCWTTLGRNVVEMFDYVSLPEQNKQTFDKGAEILLDEWSILKKSLLPKEQKLNYIYNEERKTFCFNITDSIKNKGCLKSVSMCAKSNNIVDKYNSYKLLSVFGNKNDEGKNMSSLLTNQDDGKNGIMSWLNNECDFNDTKQNRSSYNTNIKVLCGVEDGKCCYSNKNGDNNTRNKKEMCLDDENVGLSCYGEKQDPKQEFRHSYYKYYCCYHDLTKPKQGSGQQSVCWSSAQEDIWEILGFYNMSPEKRKELKDKDENYRKHLVVNKELKKTEEQRLPAR